MSARNTISGDERMVDKDVVMAYMNIKSMRFESDYELPSNNTTLDVSALMNADIDPNSDRLKGGLLQKAQSRCDAKRSLIENAELSSDNEARPESGIGSGGGGGVGPAYEKANKGYHSPCLAHKPKWHTQPQLLQQFATGTSSKSSPRLVRQSTSPTVNSPHLVRQTTAASATGAMIGLSPLSLARQSQPQSQPNTGPAVHSGLPPVSQRTERTDSPTRTMTPLSITTSTLPRLVHQSALVYPPISAAPSLADRNEPLRPQTQQLVHQPTQSQPHTATFQVGDSLSSNGGGGGGLPHSASASIRLLLNDADADAGPKLNELGVDEERVELRRRSMREGNTHQLPPVSLKPNKILARNRFC